LKEKKQKENREEEEMELSKRRGLKKEADVWKFIKKKRIKRIWRDNNRGRQHFMNLLRKWMYRRKWR